METQKEQNLREWTFAGLMTVFVLGMSLNYISEWADAALITYLVLLILCVIVVVLSVLWWWRTDGTTAVFKMIVLLSSGVGLDAIVQSWSRYLWMTRQNDRFDLFRHTWLWEYRQVVKIVALVYLLAVIVSRMARKRGPYVP